MGVGTLRYGGRRRLDEEPLPTGSTAERIHPSCSSSNDDILCARSGISMATCGISKKPSRLMLWRDGDLLFRMGRGVQSQLVREEEVPTILGDLLRDASPSLHIFSLSTISLQ